jgi:hypothetical protein
MIDAKMQKLVCAGNDDITILTEMFDYMPGFKRLMDTSESDTMDELCRRSLEVASDTASGADRSRYLRPRSTLASGD